MDKKKIIIFTIFKNNNERIKKCRLSPLFLMIILKIWKNLKMKIFNLKILSLNYKTYKIQNKIWKKKIIKNNNFKFLKLIIT